MGDAERSPLAEAVQRLFEEEKCDGTPRYGPAEAHAVRSMILLELVRRGAIDPLTSPHKAELALLFEGIGVDEHTDPKEVDGKVKRYFESLEIDPGLRARFDPLLKRYRQADDRLEAVTEAERAFDRITEREGQKAPHHEDETPDDAQAAQDLAQSLGVKLRI